MREQLAAGDDPLEIKKAEAEKVVIPTFADAARRVHAELSPGWENPKHVRQWLSTPKITCFLNWEQKRWIRLRLRTWQRLCVQSG